MNYVGCFIYERVAKENKIRGSFLLDFFKHYTSWISTYNMKLAVLIWFEPLLSFMKFHEHFSQKYHRYTSLNNEKYFIFN